MVPARLALLTLLILPTLQAQTTDARPANAMALLQQMSDHYTNATSWYIVETQERTSKSEYSSYWTKTVLIGAQSGNKYHVEAHSQGGGALHISDGKTAWDYHADEHAYTQRSAPAGDYQPANSWSMLEQSTTGASELRKELADFTKHYQSATRLPDDVIYQGGFEIPCYVIQLSTADRKGPRAAGYSSTESLWIDKEKWTVRKRVSHQAAYILVGGAHIPEASDTVMNYQVAELNTAVPDALFHFDPPPDAKLVARLADPFNPVDHTGEPAPEVQLAAADGHAVPLSSWRGKPVLLDFWATWCKPCTEGLPAIAQIAKEAAPKGLVMLYIDGDEDETAATDFLEKNHYTWPNTHDDGKIGDAFGKGGIPLLVLIDPQGKIVLYQTGEDEPSLRTALSHLGPAYASLAPPPKP